MLPYVQKHHRRRSSAHGPIRNRRDLLATIKGAKLRSYTTLIGGQSQGSQEGGVGAPTVTVLSLWVTSTSLLSGVCIQSSCSSLKSLWPLIPQAGFRGKILCFPYCAQGSAFSATSLQVQTSLYSPLVSATLNPTASLILPLAVFVFVNWHLPLHPHFRLLSVESWNKQVCLYNRSSFITSLTWKIQELNLLSNMRHPSG